jgi:hypothetical protein
VTKHLPSKEKALSVKPQCPPLHQKKAKFKNMEKVWRFSLLSSWRNSGASVSEELKTLR